MEILTLSENQLERLRTSVLRRSKIFAIRSEPELGSLIACLGIQKELGDLRKDRLSARLGLSLSKSSNTRSQHRESVWGTELVLRHGRIGLRMTVLDPEQSILPDHEDVASLFDFDPSCFNQKGQLRSALLFPLSVAERSAERGLELVIVRDWVLESALAEQESKSLNYLLTNEKEILSHSTSNQVAMIQSGQVSFSGTHDLADHLIGGNHEGFLRRKDQFSRLVSLYSQWADAFAAQEPMMLSLSYMLGVVLDDMVQPKWYFSRAHEDALGLILGVMEKAQLNRIRTVQSSHEPGFNRKATLPFSFEAFMETLRSPLQNENEITGKAAATKQLSKVFLDLGLHFEYDLQNESASICSL